MQIHPVTQEDYKALCAFAQQIDLAMQLSPSSSVGQAAYFSPVDQWGHRDLPEYLQ